MTSAGENHVEIRTLAAGDRADWLPLWSGYQAFYKVEIPPHVSGTTWSRILDPAEPVRGALAWRGGRAIGLVHFIRHRSCWTIGDYCYLQDPFVAPEQRGSGVGQRLIDHVRRVAEAEGCSRLYWLTHETNTDAMALYNSGGESPGLFNTGSANVTGSGQQASSLRLPSEMSRRVLFSRAPSARRSSNRPPRSRRQNEAVFPSRSFLSTALTPPARAECVTYVSGRDDDQEQRQPRQVGTTQAK